MTDLQFYLPWIITAFFNESLCAKHSSKDFININLLTIRGSRYHDLPFTNEKTKAKNKKKVK